MKLAIVITVAFFAPMLSCRSVKLNKNKTKESIDSSYTSKRIEGKVERDSFGISSSTLDTNLVVREFDWDIEQVVEERTDSSGTTKRTTTRAKGKGASASLMHSSTQATAASTSERIDTSKQESSGSLNKSTTSLQIDKKVKSTPALTQILLIVILIIAAYFTIRYFIKLLRPWTR